MPSCTAALCLAQLETIRENEAQRDRMARLLTQKIGEIPGVTPVPIPGYLDVYSCWMFGMSINPAQFRCTAEEFARQLTEAGIPGAGLGRYYLLPAACTFLQEKARDQTYPYSLPPASRTYQYSADTCPTARAFLENWIRWSSFSEKYGGEHCERATEIVREVADGNRV